MTDADRPADRPPTIPADGSGLLRLITDAVPALISYVGTDFRYRLANEAYRRWFGLAPGEVAGRHVRDVLGEAAWASVEPYMTRAAAGEVVTYERELTYRAGGSRVVRATYTPDRGPDGRVAGFVVLVYDLTDQRRAEAEVRRSEERYRAFVAHSTEGIWRFELDVPVPVGLPAGEQVAALYRHAHLAECNDAAARMYGYAAAGELVGARLADLLPPDDPRNAAYLEAFVRSGYRLAEAPSFERDRAGGPKVFRNSLAGEVEGGHLVRAWGTQRDVTDQWRADEALKAEARRKDEFLAVLAHELRNPLAPVRNAVHLLGLPDPDLGWVRAVLGRQVGQLTRLVDDLLDVSRISRGKVRLAAERVAVGDVLDRAVETSRPVVDAGGHRLTVRRPDRPAWVDADPTRLAQVLSNLLNNAAKYTPRGGAIELTASPAGDAVEFRVSDTGIGIPPEKLAEVFEPFAQVETALDRAQGGLGIGLTIVRRLVELHGGTVSAHSDGPGRGSTFTVRLPCSSESGVRNAESEDQSTGPGLHSAIRNPQSATRRRVLVVDDNADAADSLALLVQMMGHEVRTARDGPRALAAAAEFRPELVLLDVGMPGMSGHEVAARLRGMPEARAATIVAVTGWGQDEDRRRTREAGFDHHVVKPIEPDALQDLLAGLG
ncbi:MAG: PAS domain-containing protein [Gemmataceae bacterium]|nr:PAS domain-containing protein [Gemmataceae bacterium]